MKNKITINSAVIFFLFLSIFINAQVHFGVQSYTLSIDLSTPQPKDEMLKYWDKVGDARFPLEASLSFLQLQYGENSPVSMNASVFLGTEKAKFESADLFIGSPVLTTRLIYTGLRLRPIDFNKPNLITNIVGGVFVELGASTAKLSEDGKADVNRTPIVFGYGFAPRVSLSPKTNLVFDLGKRKYSWTNSSNTKSSIEELRLGVGLEFKLK